MRAFRVCCRLGGLLASRESHTPRTGDTGKLNELQNTARACRSRRNCESEIVNHECIILLKLEHCSLLAAMAAIHDS